MALTTCVFCMSYINVADVASGCTHPCPVCRKDLFLYKCFSCMKVSGLNPKDPPQSCPRCHTRTRTPTFTQVHLTNDLLIHNDKPEWTWSTQWQVLDLLVFRGAGFTFKELQAEGFKAAADTRFSQPTIIRDSWREKKVMTHMQTKAVLAWSKSISKATEYAYGCIKGGIGGAKPGVLYFAHANMGVDVTAEVRKFEQRFNLPAQAEGTQKEVLTPTFPKTQILATWTIAKAEPFGFFQITEKNIHSEAFSLSILEMYRKIDTACPINTSLDYEKLDHLIR